MNFELHELTIRLKALHSSLLAGYSEEDLHQLRVTLRRMRSVLRKVALDEARALRRELGDLARATNGARDWDTLVANAQDQFGPEPLRALLPLLEECRQSARAQVYRTLRSHQWRAALARWEDLADITEMAVGCHAIATRELDSILQRVNAASRKAMLRDDPRRWHKLRIAIKELRYTLDSLPHDAGEPLTARLLDECKSLQTLLGDWHDTVVHRQLLDELGARESCDASTSAGMAAQALHQALAATGQDSLELIKQRLLGGNLALAAEALAARY
ncbi:MAG: CHAD domain-containing protein [Halioglobus sp.]|nr:CHAD domain-containing protein [Halioglobus sp.]